MSQPILQKVDISHTVHSDTIQQIRLDVGSFNESLPLNKDQLIKVDNYLHLLIKTLAQFMKDNIIFFSTDSNISDADKKLFLGLVTMYIDYISQLDKLKGKDGKQNNRILDDLSNVLPEQTLDERKIYITNLISNSKLRESLTVDDNLLKELLRLAVKDMEHPDGSLIYFQLIDLLGYNDKMSEKSTVNESELSTVSPFSSDSNKKKISFSKYLKKEDGSFTPHSTESHKRPIKDDTNENSDESYKKIKIVNKDGKIIPSILKSSKSKRKPKNKLKFSEESNLIKLYGEDIPVEGVKVSPLELKKILRPFTEGEPNEKLLFEGIKIHPLKLDLKNDVIDSDITDIKGGPVSLETFVPLTYRENFKNFANNLKKLPREPVVVDDPSDMNRQPLIARAFGKNSLLLRKDRGGIPYKRVPDVLKNNYPPRDFKH